MPDRSPFDQFVDQPPTANPFDAIARDMAGEQTTDLKTHVQAAAVESPDTAARNLRIAQRIQIPVDQVQRHPEWYQQQDAIETTPFDAIVRDTPKLATWLGKPAAAAVAHDDMENLGFLEWLTSAPSQAFQQQRDSIAYAELRYKSLFSPLTQVEQDRLNAAKFHADYGGQLGAGNSWFRKSITGAGRLIAQAEKPLYYGAVGALEGLALGGAVGSIVPGVGTVTGALSTAAYTARAGLVYGTLTTTAMQETAASYDELLQTKDEFGKTIDPGVAKMAALGVGALNGLVELVGVEKFLASFPALRGLRQATSRTLMRQALRSPTVRAALGTLAKEYAGTLTTEVATEVAQKAISIAGAEMSRAASGVQPQTDKLDQLVQEAVNAIPEFALGVLPGHVMTLAHDVRRVQAAERNTAFFQALGEGVTQSKTGQRMPAALEDFLRSATKDGPVETLYAPVGTFTTYWQDQGIDPAQMAAELTGKADAYQDAIDLGKDLEIPTARYAVTLAATDHNAFFTQEMRLGPDEMNAREATAYRTQLETAIDAATTAQSAQADTATKTATGGTNASQRASGAAGGPESDLDRATAALQAKLEAAGVPPKMAATKAAVFRAAFGTLAERAGLNPGSIPGRYGAASGAPDVRRESSVKAGQWPVPAVRQPVQSPAGDGTETATALLENPGPVDTTAQPEQTPEEIDGQGPSAQPREAGSDALRGVSDSRPSARENEPSRYIRARVGEAPQSLQRRRHTFVQEQHAARYQAHVEGLFQDVLARAREVDPTISASALKSEFGARLELWHDAVSLYRESGSDPLDLLRTIASLGGIDDDGQYTGERRDLMEGLVAGKFQGIQVFTTREKGKAAIARKSKGFDLMVQSLRQDERFQWIETPDDLLSAIAGAMRTPQTYEDNVYPGSDRLRELGINPATQWWSDTTRTAAADAEATQDTTDALDTGGDASFDPSEFGQSLIDLLTEDPVRPADVSDQDASYAEWAANAARVAADPPTASAKDLRRAAGYLSHKIVGLRRRAEKEGRTVDPNVAQGYVNEMDWYTRLAGEKDATGDVLDTGEAQPRLPGDVGAVRETNVETPQIEAPFSLTSEVSRAKKGAQTELFQSAYHGTRHDVDRFSLQAIGSGEGAQAYGWGLYFASQREVAEGYRNAGRTGRPYESVTYKGTEYPGGVERAHFLYRVKKEGVEKVVTELEQNIRFNSRNGYAPEQAALAQSMLDFVRTADPADVTVKGTGRVYTVEIPDDGDYLDWDKPASQQSPKVQAALTALGVTWDTFRTYSTKEFLHWFESNVAQRLWNEDIGIREALHEGYQLALHGHQDEFTRWQVQHQGLFKQGNVDPTGQDLYGTVQMAVLHDQVPSQIGRGGGSLSAAAEGASKALNAHGVAGIRYLDGFSRSKGEGSSNYVVFDDKLVSITEYDQQQADLQQDEQGGGRRGAIRFGADRQFTIALFEKADLSTFFHESGHFFLEVYGDLVEQLKAADEATLTPAQRKMLADYAGILEALGVTDRKAIGRDQHEQFARMFESYLRDGKAPSLALRDVFATVRTWLLGIYRSLKALNAPISDEVRGIFDRMLATEQQIQEAEQALTRHPMFLTPDLAGMSPARFEFYKATVADASREARETLDAALFSDVHRQQTAEWKAERDTVQEEVASEIHQQPVYRALAAIQKGTQADGSPLVEGVLDAEPLKLSKRLLVDRYGKEVLAALPRPYVYTTDGGLDPDIVARQFGYETGDALVTALQQAVPMAQAITVETNRRMIDTHGSMLFNGASHETVQAAVANTARDRVLRMEMRALGELRRTVAPHVQQADKEGREALAGEQAERAYERRWLEAEAKLRIAIAEGHKQVEIDALHDEVHNLRRKARGGPGVIRGSIPPAGLVASMAAERVGRLKVSELRPQGFWSAARQASAAATVAAARQDFAAAITHTQQELLNLAIFRATQTAQDDVATGVKFAQGLGTPAARGRMGLAGQTYQDQIDGILDRFDFAAVSKKALERRSDIRSWVEALEGQGLPVDLPDEVLNEARRVHYTSLTVEEFAGIIDGLKAIAHLAQLATRLLTQQRHADLKALTSSLVTSIEDHATKDRTAQPRDRRPSVEHGRMIENAFLSHRKLANLLREMDGYHDGGALWDAIMRPLNAAADREAEMTADATRRLATLVEQTWPKAHKRDLYRETFIPQIGRRLSKMSAVAIALNWGSQTSRDRLTLYEGWTVEQVQAVLNTLTKPELDFVQGVFDFNESYRPQIAEKAKRLTGVEPVWVEALPIEAAAGSIRGGYYSLKYDDRLSAGAIQKVDLEAANLAKLAAFTQATTKRGFLKERKQRVKEPVRLDFGPMFQHAREVIHDLTHHEALIDVGRILHDHSVQQAIITHHGDQVLKMVREHVKDVAFGDQPSGGGMERVLNHVRTGVTIVGLGWNVTTALLQPLGFANSVVRLGGVGGGGVRWVGAGLKTVMANAFHLNDLLDDVYTQSPMMKNRGRTMMRELNEIRNSLGVDTGKLTGWLDAGISAATHDVVTRQAIANSYFWMIQKAQQMVDVPTWLGAKAQAIAAGETEDRAIAMADQAVLDSQGGGQVKDLSQVQKGSAALKVWTTFYSFGNVLFNQASETRRKGSLHPSDVGRMATDYVTLLILPAAAAYLIRDALAPGDDDTPLAEALLREELAYLTSMMVGAREMGAFLQGRAGYDGPAGARAFATLGRLEHQIEQGEVDEAAVRAANETLGIFLHYPAAQIWRTATGVESLSSGATNNPGAVVAGSPRR